MTEAFMAYPDQRFPNEMKPIHADAAPQSYTRAEKSP